MSTAKRLHYDYADYLRSLEMSELKLEYCDGVIYAIRPDGALLWYYHDGRNQGSFEWQGPKQVGTGWQSFRQVFAGDGGVIYGLTSDGRLMWYRHLGRRDGSFRCSRSGHCSR